MKDKLKTDSDGHPVECPNDGCDPDKFGADDDPISISDIDGYGCANCGCWFEANNGIVEWAYESPPVPLR